MKRTKPEEVKLLLDKDGHIQDREVWAKDLTRTYEKYVRVEGCVPDAKLLVAMGLANYLEISFFEDLTGVDYQHLPKKLNDFVDLVASCLDENGKQIDYEKRKNHCPIDIRKDVLGEFSVGAKLCACIETGIIDKETAVKMLRRARKFVLANDPLL